MEQWTDFFVAVAGAAAALAGLVIVAISVNVAEIIKYRPLPARAGAAIASLLLVLLVAIAGLAPQPEVAVGAEVLAAAAIVWVLHLYSGLVTFRLSKQAARPLYERAQVILLGQAQSVPAIVGAALLIAGSPAGIYVLFAGILAIFPLAVLDAWVLLIEILR